MFGTLTVSFIDILVVYVVKISETDGQKSFDNKNLAFAVILSSVLHYGYDKTWPYLCINSLLTP